MKKAYVKHPIVDASLAKTKANASSKKNGVGKFFCQAVRAILGFLFFSLVGLSSWGISQEKVDAVSFRMLEFPFSPSFDLPSNGRLSNINPDHFSSPSLTVQLNAVQSTVAHCVAGNPVPDAINAEIVRLLSLDSPPAILRATVSAAIHLNLKEAAPQLLHIAGQDSTLAMQIEPALARWSYEPAHEYWLRRLASDAKLDAQIQALQGLRSLKDLKDQPILENILQGSLHATIRIAAAQALGTIHDSGLEELAKQRLRLPDETGHFMAALEAARLIENHQSQEAIAILTELCQSINYSAANVAFRSLAKLKFPDRTNVAMDGLQHADPNVRKTCVQFIADLESVEYISKVADAMTDAIPENRQHATSLMATLAKKESMQDAVIENTTRTLLDTRWQGKEQAIQLACALEMRDSIPRLFELAEDPSRDVFVTAAWGLRKLVQSPDDLKRALDLTTRLTDNAKQVKMKVPTTVDDFHRIAHLLELLGEQRYEPAAGFMERFIPKDSGYHTVARATAIWGLGSIFDGLPTATCRNKIEDRMMDFRGQNPENIFVRYVATVAIGRIGDESAIPLLEQIPEPSATPAGQARDWSIQNIRNRASK